MAIAPSASAAALGNASLAPGLTAAGAGSTAAGVTGLAALAANPLTMPILAALSIGAKFIPTRPERAYRKYVREQGKRLARGEGGMSQREKQQALASGQQQVAAATEKQQAQLARGSAMGQGVSGAQQRAIRELSKGRTRAMGQVASAVTQQDLALRDAMKQQYLAGLGQSAAYAGQRRAAAAKQSAATAPFLYGELAQKGMQTRKQIGTGATAGAKELSADLTEDF